MGFESDGAEPVGQVPHDNCGASSPFLGLFGRRSFGRGQSDQGPARLEEAMAVL
jgi:hypothetical protein